MNEPWKIEQLIIYQKSWERCSTTKQKKNCLKLDNEWTQGRSKKIEFKKIQQS